MKKFLVLIPLITLLGIFGMGLLFPQEVSAKSYYYENIDVDIDIHDDSTFTVKERYTLRFDGEFHGVFREISLEDEINRELCRENASLQCGGFEWMTIDTVKGNGRELAEGEYRVFETYKSGENRLRIEWEFSPSGTNFKDESFTWEIEYTVYGGIGYFEEYDLFYWNVLFPDREVNIHDAEINIVFPEDIDFESDDLKVFGGLFDYFYDYDPETYTLSLSPADILPPYTDYTVLVKFPKDITAKYSTIIIDSDPAAVEADVAGPLDIEAAGNEILGLSAGEYLLDISAEGYLSQQKTVSLKQGETKIIQVTLQEGGSIQIDADPQDIQVYLEGEYQTLNEDNKIVGLEEGTYMLRFLKDGYYAEERTIEVKLGETSNVSVRLRKTPLTIVIEIFLVTCNVCSCLLFFVLAGVVFMRYMRKGRDPKINKAIAPEFKPPNKIIPSLLGSLKDEHVHMVDITSTIIDAAYKGYIHIRELKGTSKHYELIKKKSFSDMDEVEGFIMEQIMGDKKEMKTSTLRYSFYKKLPDIKDKIYEAMVSRGYFDKRPDKERSRSMISGIVVASIGGMLSVVLSYVGIFTLGPTLFLIGLVMAVIGRFMPAKTLKGAEILHKVRGFKMYLETAEKYTLQKLTPELFERYLSYAVVFGVEKQWAKNFEDIYKEPPDWYEGDSWTTFNALVLADSLAKLDTTVGSVMSAAPSSGGSSFGGGGWSGGGGFSGGFSGGGGGGGGGGAW